MKKLAALRRRLARDGPSYELVTFDEKYPEMYDEILRLEVEWLKQLEKLEKAAEKFYKADPYKSTTIELQNTSMAYGKARKAWRDAGGSDTEDIFQEFLEEYEAK